MPYRVGVVGTGDNARDHGLACSRVAQAELVAICDVSASALERFGDEFHVASRYSTLEDMLADQELDILIVSVWGVHHASISNAAARSGRVRAILVEKPISMDSAECQGMIETARAHDVLLMEGFKWRHDPQHLRLKQIFASGRLGDVCTVHATFSSPMVGSSSPDNWRFSASRGGGSVFDTASYLIHFARFMFEQEPVRVYASAARSESGVELSSAILLEFGDDRTALLTSSYQQAYCQTVQIIGTRGWALMDLPFDSRSVRGQEFTNQPPLPTSFRVEYDTFEREVYEFPPANQFELQLRHLCDCLDGKDEPRIPPEFSLGNMRVIEAVQTSRRTRLPVELRRAG